MKWKSIFLSTKQAIHMYDEVLYPTKKDFEDGIQLYAHRLTKAIEPLTFDSNTWKWSQLMPLSGSGLVIVLASVEIFFHGGEYVVWGLCTIPMLFMMDPHFTSASFGVHPDGIIIGGAFYKWAKIKSFTCSYIDRSGAPPLWTQRSCKWRV